MALMTHKSCYIGLHLRSEAFTNGGGAQGPCSGEPMALGATGKKKVTVFSDIATIELFVVRWAAAHPCSSE